MHAYDDRYGYPGRFELMHCSDCGHRFLDSSLTAEQLVDLYTDYYPRKILDVAQYQPHREIRGFGGWFNGLNASAFRYVPKNVRVLDVGCGFGQSLGYHIARGCDVYGVEADENIRRVAERFDFKVHVGLFDANIYEPESFDYVTMDQVIEHVSDPVVTLRGVARILRPGGTAVLSTPNSGGWGAKVFGRRWINWHAPYHMQFFSLRSLQLAAEEAGLTVIRSKTITNSEWLYYQWIHLVTYPEPSEPSRFWSMTAGGNTPLQQRILKALALMHRIKIDHVLTRLFDGLGLGDNRVFLLQKI